MMKKLLTAWTCTLLALLFVSCRTAEKDPEEILRREADLRFHAIREKGELRILMQKNVRLQSADTAFLRKIRASSGLKIVSAGEVSLCDAIACVRSGKADACVLDLRGEDPGNLHLLFLKMPAGKLFCVSPYAQRLLQLLSPGKH